MDIKTIMQKLDRLSDQVAVLGKIQQVLLQEVLDLSPNRKEMMLHIMSSTLAVDSLRNEFTEYAMEQDNDALKILSMEINNIADRCKEEAEILKDLDFEMEDE